MSLELKFNEWSTKHLGKATGSWYTPYLKQMGSDLKEFLNMDKYKDNFFKYESYKEYKKVYQSITGESDQAITQILEGSNKMYPVKARENFRKARKLYAQRDYEQGTRNRPDNFGGIASYGTVLRAYLKFIYYYDHPEAVYPKSIDKTGKKIWMYHLDDQEQRWAEEYEKEYISLKDCELGILERYESREIIEEAIEENNVEDATALSTVYWQFISEAKEGDMVYVKTGQNLILGKGEITGEYYYEEDAENTHRYPVNWLQTGEWNLNLRIVSKPLTDFTEETKTLTYIEQVLAGEITEAGTHYLLFIEWLKEQDNHKGMNLDQETINQRINTLDDIQSQYLNDLYNVEDIDRLRGLKDKITLDEINGVYTKNPGNNAIALESYIQYMATLPTIIVGHEKYGKQEFLEEVFISEEKYRELKSILENTKNIILTGPPGVGKTFIADRLAYSIMGEKDNSRIQFVQFHQSYTYEDFVEGFRPKEETDGFKLETGPFVRFANIAAEDSGRPYFMIIDEINRGNLSKIFGELMMLIENDKRGKSLNLLYSKKPFRVPENLYIIGTMNTADRSLALLDYALRRRFAFIELEPSLDNETFLSHINEYEDSETILKMISKIKSLNKVITSKISSDFMIGHSYFVDEALRENTKLRLSEIITYEITPQLKEYWIDDPITASEEIKKLEDFINEFKYTD